MPFGTTIWMKAKTMKTTQTRRSFVQQTGAALAGASLLGLPSLTRAASPNEKIILGLMGPGGMGMNHLRTLADQSDVDLAFVCDPDAHRRERAAQEWEKRTGRRPKAVADMRQVFEDKTVDAVFIATPDHWHAPATVLACEAGKHVYVEKPCAHNVREGRLMIEAARRHQRVVQVGTQSRSTQHVQEAVERLHKGAIGEILVAKVWNSQKRSNIGHAQPAPPPSYLDFDLWLGPAPKVPYRSNLLHATWRWFRAFGTGDMGNDGVHDLDIGRWGLDVQTHPARVAALGGKYFFDDDQEFPDTQSVLFEYEPAKDSGRPRQLIFEQRIWSPYVQEGHENGNAFYGTEGMMILGKHDGWKLFGPRNQLRESMQGSPDLRAHHRDFFDHVRNGRRPHADVEIAHHSTTLCHLGNIATRLKRTLQFDGAREQFLQDDEANASLHRAYRPDYWAVQKVFRAAQNRDDRAHPAFLRVGVVALRQPPSAFSGRNQPRPGAAERGATRRSATSSTMVDPSARQKVRCARDDTLQTIAIDNRSLTTNTGNVLKKMKGRLSAAFFFRNPISGHFSLISNTQAHLPVNPVNFML
jgi:predicted dehydrogenase